MITTRKKITIAAAIKNRALLTASNFFDFLAKANLAISIDKKIKVTEPQKYIF